MNKRDRDIEIMAPAGSFETLMAAIQGGADSVYFGVGNLNMRSKSAFNFTINDLPEIVQICKTHQIKSYLTVNTVIYDNDIADMQLLLDAAKTAGITAIIASDLAVLEYGKQIGIELHASTQLNISNYNAVRFFATYCDVLVLARELSVDQMKYICQQIDTNNLHGPKGQKIRIEVFAHGALCMAVSGKCYLSLHENNHSANRGQCLQTCRKAYTVKEKESGYELDIDNEYIMSPKDLCTINFLDKLLDTGIEVLKIEGRARSPEYVKTVVANYKEAVEYWKEDRYNEENINRWLNNLSSVFNRGFWDGYYLGRKMGEWSNRYGSSATRMKVYLGKVTNYFSKLEVAEVYLETKELNISDDILIIGPTSGVVETKIEELRLDTGNVNQAVKSQTCSFKVPQAVRRNDKLYKWVHNP